MAGMTARKTEYKGVVYRSKSEAMFSRWIELDLTGLDCEWGFEYEPALWVDSWQPDFLVWWVMPPEPVPVLNYRLIEYKPSLPTETCIDEFEERCSRLLKMFDNRFRHDFSRNCECRLYYGSVWTQERGVIQIDSDFGPRDDFSVRRSRSPRSEDDWLADYEHAVKQTRFDLQQS